MIIQGNIWDIYKDYDAICCTTNQVVKPNGELVMGAGVAKQFASKYTFLAKRWGKIANTCLPGTDIKPEFFVTLMSVRPHLCFFATKHDWREKSKLRLIELSMAQLCTTINILGWKKVLLPKPGCSNCY